MPGDSQLAYLRKFSSIDCDTLDFHVAKNLGPFVDCTSNQAIAFFELQKESNSEIITKAAHFAHEQYLDDGKRIACGVKAMMVLLSLRMLPYLSGRVHTQSTMHAAHSKDATVLDALQIIEIYKLLSPGISIDNVVIKIPATFEGLAACRVLEAQGIRTLATTLFTIEQAILAHEVGCTYVAPYVNELRIHFVAGAVDKKKAFPVVKEIFQYYEACGSKTRVLPASLVSKEEVLSLAGVHHITISSALCSDLAISQAADDLTPPYDAQQARLANVKKRTYLDDESSFKEALASDVEASRKLEEAISWFLKFELDLEEMMRAALNQING